MINSKKVGLSLSGGGYRAAAFHLGTLRKLDQLGVLDKVDVISTISGGSITGACWGVYDREFSAFDKEMQEKLTSKSVIRYVLTSWASLPAGLIVLAVLAALFWLPFTDFAWVSVAILVIVGLLIWFFQFRIFPVSTIIENAYNTFFYEGKILDYLKEHPVVVIGSTNLETCRQFYFSKYVMEDSAYTYREDPILFESGRFPIARAVMASSCVPFAFTPIPIGRRYFKNPAQYPLINPRLVDGGVYDNQGIHRITQSGRFTCDVVITSDAGNKLPFNQKYNNVFVLLIRTMDVFMQRIKNFQLIQNVYENAATAKRQVAYLSLGWDPQSSLDGFVDNLAKGNITLEVITAHGIPPEWCRDVENFRQAIFKLLADKIGYSQILQQALTPSQLAIARGVGTNLTALTKEQVNYLTSHAACMTELQVKLYCPLLLS
jgi:NTE family protein